MQRRFAILISLFLSGILACGTYTYATAKPYQAVVSDLNLDNNTIEENQPEGSLVGTITAQGATDFSLADENSPFSISDSLLITNQLLNFEAQNSYSITIIATDSITAEQISEEFTILVLDLNDAPVFTLTNSSLTVPFNTTDLQTISDFVTEFNDGDSEVDQVLTFVLTPDADNTISFSQEPSIDVEGTLTFQLADNASGVAGFTIVLEDNGDQGGDNVYQSAPQGFTITVEAPVVEAPTAITLDPASPVVEENQGSVTVGILSANGTAPITFSLPQGEANNDFFTISGNELATTGPLDFETTPSLSVLVQASNSAGSTSQDFPVAVTNAEEPPADIELSSSTVADGAAAGTVVGTLSATGGSVTEVTFSLPESEADNDSFTIQNSNELTTAQIFNFAQQATYSVVVQASGDGTYQETFTVTVTAPENVAPEASNLSVTTDFNTAVIITLTAEDQDGDELTFEIVEGPENGSLGTISGNEVVYTPATGFSGEDSFTFQANDGSAPSNVATVSITVEAPANQAPVADAGPDQNVPNEDDNGFQTVTLDGSASDDPDGEIVSYIWTNEADEEIATGISPSVNLPVGVHLITLTVTDDDNETDTDEVSITIEEAENQEPTADAGDDIAVTDEDNDGEESINLDGSGSSDPDGDALTYTWFNGDTEIATGVSPTITLAIGNYSLRLVVSDGEAEDEDQVSVQINEASNSIPVAQNRNVETDENTSVSIELSATDEDGDALTYTIENPPANGELDQNGELPGNEVVYTPGEDFTGSDSFTFSVNDGNDDSNIATVGIQVNAVNEAPILTQEFENITVEENADDIQIDLNEYFQDADGDVLSYNVDNSDTDLLEATVSSNTLTLNFIANTSGEATLSVEASDGEFAVEDAFTVTVEAIDRTPFFSLISDAFEASEDFAQAIMVEVQPEDESQQVNYSIAPPSIDFATLTADNSEGIYNFSSLPDRNGEQNFTITAENEQGDTHQENFTFRVNAINDAPVFTLSQNELMAEAGSGEQTFTAFATGMAAGPQTATDETAQSLAFTLAATNPALFAEQPFINNEGNLSFTPAENGEGETTVAVTLTDNGPNNGANQNSSTQTFTINVNEAELLAPEFTISPSEIVVDEDFEEPQTITVTPTDLSLVPTYSLNPETVPSFADISIDAFTGTVTITHVDNASGSTDGIEIIATSLLGETYSQTFSLTVNAVNDIPSFTLSDDPAPVEANAGLQSVSNFASNINDGDPDEDQTLEFVVDQTEGDLSFTDDVSINEQGTLTYEAAVDATGSAIFEVYLRDDGTENNQSETQTFTITVEEAEVVAPSFTLNPDALELEEDFTNTVTVSLTPQTDTEATYSLDNNVDFATVNINTNTGAVSVESIANASGGPVEISITATDVNDEENTFTASFFLEVTPENDAPVVVNPIDDREVEENAGSFNINISNVFEDVEDNNLDVTSSSDNTGLVEVNINGVNLNINITPEAFGSALITLTAEDDEGESAETSFTITVLESEDATPFFSLVQEIFEVNEDFTQTVSVEVQPDDEDQEVSYSIVPSEIDFATLTANNNDGIYNFSSLPDRNGEQNFTITAENDQGNTHQESFTFRVIAVNDQPVFELAQTNVTAEIAAGNLSFTDFATNILPGPATAVDEQSQTLAFTTTAADPTLFDGQPAINNNGTLTFTPADDNSGNTSVEVTLTDNIDLPADQRSSRTTTFNISVTEQPTAAPTANAGDDRTVTDSDNSGSEIVTLDGSGSLDSDGPLVSYIWTEEGNQIATGVNPEVDLTVGAHTILLTVTDSDNETAFDEVVITVVAPAITAPTTVTLNPPTPTVPENQENAIVGTLTSNGTAPVTFSLADDVANNNSFTISGNQLLTSGALNYENAQSLNVQVTATNGGGSTTGNFTIAVGNVAEPPTSISLSNTTVADGSASGTLVGTLSSQGGASTTVIFSLPEGEANNGSFTIQNGNELTTAEVFNFADQETYSVLVRATGDGTYDETFSITVTPPDNTAPVASNVEATTGFNTSTTITLTAEDADEDELTFSIVQQPTNGTLGAVSGNQVEYTPNTDYSGEDTFTFQANDGNALSNIATVTVTVSAPDNTPPVASNVTGITTQQATSVTIQLTATDAEGNTLTFAIVAQPENGSVTAPNAAGEVTYTPDEEFFGEDTFTFRANDNTEDSNIASVSVNVNARPIANAGEDQNVVDIDGSGSENVTLDGSASSDPDGSIATYSWTEGETQLATGATPPAFPLSAGTHTILLTVTDDAGGTATDEVVITVTAPEAPAFSFEPESFSAAEDFEGTQSVSIVPTENTPAANYSFDPALNTITFADVIFDEENLQFNITASENAFGSASIAVTATDQSNAANQATATLNITVTSVNDEPVVVNEIDDVTVNENADDSTIDVSNVFSDVEDEELALSASSENEGLVTVAIEGTTLTLSFVEGQSGNTTVSVTATDSEGAFEETIFTVTVNPVNDAPVITSTNPVTTNEDEVFTIPFSAFNVTDPDNDYPDDFIIILEPGSNYTLQDNNTAILPVQDFFGTLTVPAIVNDGENNSNEVELTVTVQNVNDTPILALGNTTPIVYNRNDPPVNIAASLSITDVDNSTLQSATISFGQESPFFYDESEDLLEYTASGGISGSWDANNGIFTLTGEAPINSYIAAITSITYVNQQADPSPNPRELNFTVSDGDQSSAIVVRYISIDGSNIPPQLTDFERQIPEDEPLAFTADDFSSNYTDDIDAFNNIVYITRLPETGSLVVGGQTLTDNDLDPTTGGYVLNFNNVSGFQYIPDADFNGTDAFGWTALDSELEPGYVGNAANVTITVLPVNDAPRISAPSSVSVNENTDFDFSDTGNIVIDDVDSSTDVLTVSMSVQEGLINFTNTGLLEALTFVEGDGIDDATMEFSGTETAINAALTSVQYRTPEGFSGNDLLMISATDPQNSTGNATVTILVNQVNALPTLANMESEPLEYNEESGPVQITNTITIEDRENDNMIAATISISENFVASEDQLTFDPVEGITGRVSENRLILTGNAPIATYQALLRSIRYVNNSETPQESVRRINFQVTDVNNGSSNILSRFINVTRLNGPLQLTNIERTPLTYQPGDPQQIITQSLAVSDTENEVLTTAIVRFTEDSYVPQEDVLIFDSEDFEANWDEEEGILTITGNSSAQAYQDALRSIQYLNTSDNPTLGSRWISFTVFRNEISSNEAVRQLLISNNELPIVSDFTIDLLKNAFYPFNEADFSNYYNDPDNSPENLTFVRLRISELPVRGQLYLNDEVITQEMLDVEGALEVNTGELSQLTYQPEEDYTGLDSLVWNAFDGEDYAATNARLIFNITDLEVNAGDDVEACQGDSVALSVSAEGGNGNYTFNWTCDQANCGIDNPNAAEVNVFPDRTTTYFVNVVDENGVTSNGDTIVVSTIACYGLPLDIPTAFTPNGDGPNDSWVITNIETYQDQVVEVYDRYGKRVFFSDGYRQPWDGSQNGQILPTGTYYYFIRLNKGEKQHRGSVSILK